MYVIYKIYYNDVLLYIGSTIDFKKRKREHKSNCYNQNSSNYNLKLYKYIRDNNIVFDEDLIWNFEQTNIIDKTEARKLEGKYITELQPLCNNNVAGRSEKEYFKQWYEDNRDYKKQWIENNRDYIKEYEKQRYQNNREQILERQREYNKQRYQNNREQILERKREQRAQKKLNEDSQN